MVDSPRMELNEKEVGKLTAKTLVFFFIGVPVFFILIAALLL